MSTWNINLEKKTATSINGITFKLTEVEPGTFQWICTNPKAIPPNNIDDEILCKMVREADAMYQYHFSYSHTTTDQLTPGDLVRLKEIDQHILAHPASNDNLLLGAQYV